MSKSEKKDDDVNPEKHVLTLILLTQARLETAYLLLCKRYEQCTLGPHNSDQNLHIRVSQFLMKTPFKGVLRNFENASCTTE